MKYIYSIFFISFFNILNGVCQEKTFENCVFNYKIEKVSYLELFDFEQNSNIHFYSQSYGGRLLKQNRVDENGRFKIIKSDRFKPAFVLNKKSKETSTGNNKVTHIEEELFDVNHIKFHDQGESLSLSWNCNTRDENAAFMIREFYADESGSKYAEHLLDANSFNTFQSDLNVSELELYYTSNLIDHDILIEKFKDQKSNTAFMITPNISSQFFSIAGENVDQINMINIYNLEGRVLQSSKFNSRELNLQEMNPGQYLIQIEMNSGKMETHPVIKI